MLTTVCVNFKVSGVGILSTANEDPSYSPISSSGAPDSGQEQFNWTHHSGQVTGIADSNVNAAFRLTTKEPLRIGLIPESLTLVI